MKEKDGFVDCPEQQVILYVEKEDGKYVPMQTGSYITKNFLDDYQMKRKNLEESLRQEVEKGIKSPVHYFMILEDLTLSELAARVGLRKSKVLKHLEPKHYRDLEEKIISRYADVFNVSTGDITKLMPLNK